jgi:hypothetical protein
MTRVDREAAEAHVNQMLQRRAAQLAAEVEALAGRLSEPISLGDLEESEIAGGASSSELLAAAVRSLARCEDQQALLDRLLEGASRCFSRTCLFLVREDSALGWSSVGLPESDGEDPAKSLKISLADQPLLGAARDNGSPARTEEPEKAAAVLPAVEPGQRMPRRAVVIPLRVGERVSALLYGDDGGDAAEAFEEAEAEILALVTSLSAERLRLPQAPVAEAGAEMVTDVRIGLPARDDDEAPEALDGEVMETSPLTPDPLEPEPLEEELEIGSLSLDHAPAAGALSTDEARLHEDARRFARLLVSELLLYNEDSVVAGRRQRDLYQRLKPEIDKSREAYDRRVPDGVRAGSDYFKEELVRTLALGDPLALGTR